jgi:glycosyltransferase involved in cell wall biosynthesis
MTDKNNLKKICIAIHGLAHAGAERVAASWANYLTKQGHSVTIMVYARGEDAYDLDSRVRVVPIADTEAAFFGLPKWTQLGKIRAVIRQEAPQILISFLPKLQINMMLATFGLRVKRIETIRNNPWVDTDVGSKRFLWDLCFRRSDAIIVQNREQSLYFPEKLREKCVVISNPISRDFVSRQKVYGGERVKKFIAVARLSKQKNYPMMIRAFAQVARKNPDCTLDIYGGGSEDTVAALHSLIAGLDMERNIRLRGWHRDISGCLLESDAFLMSSDYEGMPNALAEAMAAGLVSLSTDCRTGPKDMIDPGVNGLLATTGDEQAFARGIQTIVEMDPRQCAAMGQAAREKILAMCGEENTLERLRKLIESEM